MDEWDLALIRDVKTGNAEAFAALVRNYKTFVYRTAFSVVQNRSDAEDITQEAFIKVYKSLGMLRDEHTFPSWIAKITVRTALDWIGRMNRYPTVAMNVEQVTVDPHQSTAVRLDMEQTLLRLSTDLRTVLVLRELHGFHYEELAEILDIPVGTVRSRLHHARLQLRLQLQDERRTP